MTEPDSKAPTYARSLTRKERDDRNEQLLAQLKVKRELEPKLEAAKKDAATAVRRIKKQLETVNEMIDILAQEVETGHAHVAKQLELGSVPKLADADGNAVDDPRDAAAAGGDDDDDDDDDGLDELDAEGDPLPAAPYAGVAAAGADVEGEPGVRPAKKRGKKAAGKKRRANGAARAHA